GIVDLRRGGAIQPGLANVADHADDRAASGEDLSDRIFVGKVLPRESFVDEQDLGRVARVSIGQTAAAEERDSHRAEVLGRHVAKLGAAFARAAGDRKTAVPVRVLQRQQRNEPRRAHPWYLRDAFLQSARFVGARDDHVQREHIFGAETRRGTLQIEERAQQQTGAGLAVRSGPHWTSSRGQRENGFKPRWLMPRSSRGSWGRN